jgi:hypothetical protein
MEVVRLKNQDAEAARAKHQIAHAGMYYLASCQTACRDSASLPDAR